MQTTCSLINSRFLSLQRKNHAEHLEHRVESHESISSAASWDKLAIITTRSTAI
jgi:hypothetical protein